MTTQPEPRYGLTRGTCYLGTAAQAAMANIWPLLFVLLRESFGLTYLQLATLISVIYIVRIGTDLLFSKAADKFGFRPFMTLAMGLTAGGFLLFAAMPLLTGKPYPGFIAAAVLFSVGGGLNDILASPLVDRLPHKSKSGNLSFLHAVYSFGQASVIMLTSLALFLFGDANWQWVVAAWALIPIAALILYLRVPLPDIQSQPKQQAREIEFGIDFWLCFLIMLFGAGAECTMLQWSSTFMEKAADLPKLLGDYAGVLMFALLMGTSRLIYGLFSNKLDAAKFMLFGAVAGVISFPLTALSDTGWLNLAGCALTGLAVGMFWPGTLVLGSQRYPNGGAWLFAILALGGDIGAAFCPWLAGLLVDHASEIPFLSALGAGLTPEQLGLRSALTFSAIYPLIAVVLLMVFIKRRGEKSKEIIGTK